VTSAPRESPPLRAALQKLLSQSAIYGAADVFTNVVNFLLVPVYTKYLSPTDYGTLGILLLFSTVAKVVFRMGLDAGFLRVYYDQPSEEQKRRLAGTVALFAVGTGTVLFAGVVALAPALSRLLLDRSRGPYALLLILAAADVYVGTFAFVPLNLLRIQDRPRLFSIFSSVRQAVNTVLKVVFVVRGFGVEGVLFSDVIATTGFALALLPITLSHASWAFSRPLLREVLSFGLPKVPHGVLIQVQNLGDRKILDLFVSRAEVGIYHVGYTFGMGVKFALSAFEPAWQPFIFAQIRKPNAPFFIARIVTYVFAAFVALGLVVAVFSRELVRVMTRNPVYWAAAPVVPVVTLAYVFHGLFLLTSLGIAIEKKARYYPIVTLISATANVAFNLLLIPSFGMMGAAWATVISYAVMAGMGFFFARRLYPIPFEWGRLFLLLGGALATFGLTLLAPDPLITAVAFKTALLLVFPLVVLCVLPPLDWKRT
jgi:O-antigen/teichoic acid export membrane protein